MKATIRIRIVARDLPGRTFGAYADVRVGLQVGKEYLGLVAGDATGAEWETEASLAGAAVAAAALRGPAIHGRGEERFLYLGWIARGVKDVEMFRRAKLQLDAVPAALLERAARGGVLVAELSLRDPRGAPLCASVRPPAIRWSVSAGPRG